MTRPGGASEPRVPPQAINVAADSPKLAQLMSQITRYALESVFPTIDGLAEAVDA